MEHIKAYFKTIFEHNEALISLAAIDNPVPYNPMIDGLDLLLLVVSTQNDPNRGIEHVRIGEDRVQIRTVSPVMLEQWTTGGENRSIIQWLVRGEILVDRDNYLFNLRESLLSFPASLRGQKELVEFSHFIRSYLQAKQDLQDNNLLDAYSNVLTALHHWAHIAFIEEGVHPELTVWRQMRRFNPGIYKLYEELTISPESLEKRVQLVLLACEFSVMSKMKSSCGLLFSILGSREEPWSVMELQTHPHLKDLHMDLSLLLQKLVMRGYIREVAYMPLLGDTEALELRYHSVS
ncbi:nucleotidyltransferase-like protein [Paenibacillus sp. CF384]|uniref:nucleotidyltransferase-like protein n=1 Tax=Paenibacillus sp. CF384 TaxID=1884382 RepID=UPI0008986CE6|nr:nucleotidyltransferase-like protein [Paenibacillus sp. CF384]SDX43890.1 Nucleotidyltransferase-like [Paenibacillus sp. CF384]